MDSLNAIYFFFSSRRRHTRSDRDGSSDVCSSDLLTAGSTAATNQSDTNAAPRPAAPRSEERREGKSVDLGGRRIIKKKKQDISLLAHLDYLDRTAQTQHAANTSIR